MSFSTEAFSNAVSCLRRRFACFGWMPALFPVLKNLSSPLCWKLLITEVIVSCNAARLNGGQLEKWDGDPGKTRTSDKQFRKLLLYPPELRGPWYLTNTASVYRNSSVQVARQE
jgi:hypothetical protein